ncbi:MAG: ankyrin repeat domain-containing protein [Candidatus Chromulinivorax sp.]
MKNLILNLSLFLAIACNLFSIDKKAPYKKISPEELAILHAKPFRYQALPTELQRIIREFAGLETPVEAVLPFSQTQLQDAITNFNTDRVQILIALGVDPNATPYYFKCRPLINAIINFSYSDRVHQKKEIGIISYLLKNGADVNLKNENNNDPFCKESPIFQAVASCNNIPILKMLLQCSNINLTIKNKDDQTVLDIINEELNSCLLTEGDKKEYYKMAQMLKKHNAPSSIPLEPLLYSDQVLEKKSEPIQFNSTIN